MFLLLVDKLVSILLFFSPDFYRNYQDFEFQYLNFLNFQSLFNSQLILQNSIIICITTALLYLILPIPPKHFTNSKRFFNYSPTYQSSPPPPPHRQNHNARLVFLDRFRVLCQGLPQCRLVWRGG